MAISRESDEIAPSFEPIELDSERESQLYYNNIIYISYGT